MAFNWTIFRIVADLSHFVSKCILIWSIHSNKSAEGVSLITQIWYLVVFCARYLPMGIYAEYDDEFHTVWNFSLKVIYIASSAYIVYIMMRVFARTREREKAWKMGIATMLGSLLLAPLVMLALMKKIYWSFSQFAWSFSIILESVCVLPQLLLLRETSVPTVIDSFYLVTLGSYRGFYILNWIVVGARHAKDKTAPRVEPIAVIFGVIQTALYIDFAWVYFTRQRVKLRGGSVVDSDDMSKGWLVKRLLGRQGAAGADEENDAPDYNHHNGGTTDTRPKPSTQKWGPRGISVSADEGVLEGAHDDLDDPREFEDDNSDDETPKLKSVGHDGAPAGNGEGWSNDRS